MCTRVLGETGSSLFDILLAAAVAVAAYTILGSGVVLLLHSAHQHYDDDAGNDGNECQQNSSSMRKA